eukprot:6641004-Prymnesium_polylepis.1
MLAPTNMHMRIWHTLFVRTCARAARERAVAGGRLVQVRPAARLCGSSRGRPASHDPQRGDGD